MAGTPRFGTRRPTNPAQPAYSGQIAGQAHIAFSRTQRETARVQLRSRSHWPGVLMLLVLMAAAGVAAVHYFVVPLDVLLAWRKPARLSIATEPEGASLRLNGVALAAPSPTIVSVKRDLADHIIEATLPGYHQARAIARYDRSLSLSFLLRLQKDPTVVVPSAAIDAGAASPAPPAASPTPPAPSAASAPQAPAH
ncbi:MAG TPA: hypothetical protein VIK30_07245 [Polyangia bacterium]